MAHAIADSDEEGDEITVAQTGVEDPEPNGRNRQTESAADGSNGDSTGSTGKHHQLSLLVDLISGRASETADLQR